jgi:hypothetical protein
LGRLFRRRGEQQYDGDFVIVERKAVGREPEDQFRSGKIVDAQMGHGNAVADVTVALVFLVRSVGAKLGGEIRQAGATAQVIDGVREISLKTENDLCGFKTLRDHGTPLFKADCLRNRNWRTRPIVLDKAATTTRMKMASWLTAIRPVASPRIVRLASRARCFASLAKTAAVTQVAER